MEKYKKLAVFSLAVNILLIGGYIIYQKISVSEQQYVLIKTNFDDDQIYRYNVSLLPSYSRSADLATGNKAYSMGPGIYRIVLYEVETKIVLLDINVIVSRRYTELSITIKNNMVVGISA